MDKIADILKRVAGRYPGFAKRIREAEALSGWEAAVGPAISKHSRAVRIDNGVLHVEVDHPIWKSELHHRKRQILELMNGKAAKGETPLTDLVFFDKR
jgi:predicted nucleic acid-binding Zn ribbon protein